MKGGELDGTGCPTNKDGRDDEKRVIVVHCKAGKGRSGTSACSYLISECGWTPEDAIARFTERRMKPRFGAGVSIPSQLRWVSYVDRWTKGGKKYVDREVEIIEIHTWGLRHGVKIAVEGFVDEGKKIKVFHTFTRDERIVVEGDAPGGSGGIFGLVSDMAGYGTAKSEDEPGAEYGDVAGDDEEMPHRSRSKKLKRSVTSKLIRGHSKSPGHEESGSSSGTSINKLGPLGKSKTIATQPATDAATTSTPNLEPSSTLGSKSSASSVNLIQPRAKTEADLPSTTSSSSSSPTLAASSEPGGQAVIFKPTHPIRIPNSDVNIDMERRNRGPAGMGLNMVTSVGHVWFNTFFEGNGPEQDGKPDESGVFEIEWDKMDGIKGSLRKGTRACDRIAVVWRAVKSGRPDIVVHEPGEGSPVPQMRPADWTQERGDDPEKGKGLGLKVEGGTGTDSEVVSLGSSVQEEEGKVDDDDEDGDSLKGVKTSGPAGEEELEGDHGLSAGVRETGKGGVDVKNGFVVE